MPPTENRSGRRGFRAFTLPEVMIAATLSVFTLAGVLSAFLLIGRTALSASNYGTMENQIRHALNLFSADARGAADIRWESPRAITLIMPPGTPGPGEITYRYIANDGSALGIFRRETNDGAAARDLVDNVASDFSFQRYKLQPSVGGDNLAANDLETKQIQLTLRALSLSNGSPAASQTAISTSCVLRNKNVSQ
ncbi:MAG: hypothetical protein ABII82_03730 [Verrucomicrobiota bacterium]